LYKTKDENSHGTPDGCTAETKREESMTEQSATAPTTYRIGAVARLTGVAADTLRVWERRYGAVSPQRSARGGRLYSPDDVARLRLMKHLVEAGDAISTVATLGLDALRARVADARSLPLPPGNADDETPVRVLLVGESLAAAVRSAPGGLPGITPVAAYRDLADFEARAEKQAAQVLVVEMATLHEDSGARIIEWLGRAGAAHALIVYRYASADALLRLPAWKCLALRAPVDAVTLEAHCLAMGRAAVLAPAPLAADVAAIAQAAPPRRYDDETLAQLATLSSTVKCECPRHLAELISSLSAFERYSTECESRSPRDAALHAYLHATASQARHLVEDALGHVLEVENIQV
jgi:DNA-binding transcriptional MerR regulator